MRILHTSDLHLGHRLCDRDRYSEHDAFIDWLVDTICSNSIDLLLVCGDVFDSYTPSNKAQEQYYRLIHGVHSRAGIPVIITGGNHDSGTWLDAPSSLLDQFNVHVKGSKPDNIEELIVDIRNKEGVLTGVVCAVPYLRERDVRSFTESADEHERTQAWGAGVAALYTRLYEKAAERTAGTNVPVIATGHCFMTGASLTPDEESMYIGGLGQLSSSVIPEGLSACFLGHIHTAQKLSTKVPVFYSGTPVPLDFSERGKRFVYIHEFANSELCDSTKLQVPVTRRLSSISGSLASLREQIRTMIEESNVPVWFDIELPFEEDSVNAHQALIAMVENEEAEVLKVRMLRDDNLDNNDRLSVQSLDNLKEVQVFEAACRQAGLDEDNVKELIPFFDQLLDEVSQGVFDED